MLLITIVVVSFFFFFFNFSCLAHPETILISFISEIALFQILLYFNWFVLGLFYFGLVPINSEVLDMGTCCTKEAIYAGGFIETDIDNDMEDVEENFSFGDCEARIRLRGSSQYISMHTQQGKKGINQDAMTVWEKFAGGEDTFFCGVFDGHGPYGHKLSRTIRDNLPSKLSKAIKLSQLNNSCEFAKEFDTSGRDYTDDSCDSDDHFKDCQRDNQNIINNNSQILPLSSWEACLIKAFKEMDDQLKFDSTTDSFCSGSTAVTIVKQAEHLIISNLGDSRAVLCTREHKNQLVPVQLTLDLTPDIPSEAERIRKCQGRIFAAEEEPDVYRIWMPEEDCPGLAMARAFGDFCLKDYGLISTPDVSYRKLTPNDEFVVLATDGVWDALTNAEVIRIVASAKNRSNAAKLVINRATLAWRSQYPDSKVDDCAVICFFFKEECLSISEAKGANILNHQPKLTACRSTITRLFTNDQGSADSGKSYRTTQEYLTPLDGIKRVNSAVKIPRFLTRRNSF